MQEATDLRNLKRMIWLYFWLLIFEGVFRKWILPQFGVIFIYIRDPLVLLIYFYAAIKGRFPQNGFVLCILVLGIGTLCLNFFTSYVDSLSILAIGFRTNYLHFPLIFIMGAVLTIEDVQKIGRWLLILAIPMMVLMAAQYSSPADSLLNLGESTLNVEYARVRPSATFSFITGSVLFFSLVGSYIFYGVLSPQTRYRQLSLMAAGISLLVAATLSNSRTFVVSIGFLLGLSMVCVILRPHLFMRGLWLAIAVVVMVIGVLSFDLTRGGVDKLNERRVMAEEGEGNISNRFLSSLLEPYKFIFDIPVFGYGLGLGGNAAAVILTGEAGFLLSENEWPRVILEIGPILGIFYIGYRILLIFSLGVKSIGHAHRGNILPLLILGACCFPLLNGQFYPPVILGFAVFGGGLCLAAMNEEKEKFTLDAI